MAKITINGNITGNNNHFGDNYITPLDFINNSHLDFSSTEKELVKIIFENTETEEERKAILSSLTNLKNEKVDVKDKSKDISILRKFGGKLLDSGASELVKKAISFFLNHTEELKDFNPFN